MSAPMPAPDDPTPIDPVTDPPLDPPADENPQERDSSKEGPWRPGDKTGSDR
jgi:hypothetical protein